MNAYGWAALALVAAVAALALTLTLVLARRLRDLNAKVSGMNVAWEPDLPEIGPLPAFSATTIAGGSLDPTSLGPDDRIVAFLYGSCESCHDSLPKLVREFEAQQTRALAVVLGRQELTRDMIEALRGVADVVAEPDMGGIARAFHVSGFPTYLRIGDGQVLKAGHSLDELYEPAVPIA